MAAVTLRDALENVEASLITERKKGLEDLKHILRTHQNTGKIESLGDDSFHRIFEALFQASLKEKANTVKSASAATIDAACGRLTDIAATLRQWIESGVKYLTKVKTVRAVYGHISDSIAFPDGNLCEPLALEYAKSLRTLFSFQPHVERLADDWKKNVDFAITTITAVGKQTEDCDPPTSTIATTNSHSYRSSRSGMRETVGSQGARSGLRAVIPEMIACLQLLTSVPNAPLEQRAQEILVLVTEFLKTSSPTSAANQDAFNTINNILSWSRTEAINLTKGYTSTLLRLVSSFWSSKSNNTEQMLITLLLLRPYFMHEMRQPAAHAVRLELTALLQVLSSEYSKRLDRDRLSMDELRLKVSRTPDLSNGEISMFMFELRCCGVRAESNWLLLDILASIYKSLSPTGEHALPDPGDQQIDDTDPNPRHRKRQRTEDQLGELLRTVATGNMQEKVSAIQVLTFLSQQQAMAAEQVLRVLNSLSTSCNEEHPAVAAWAYLAVACFASQPSATNPRLASHWATLWQVACRTLSNNSTCRSASYTLHVMITLRLVSHSAMSDLVQSVTNTMDLSGPSMPSDAASLLLASILHASQRISPASAFSTVESILLWISRAILPSRFEDKAFAIATGIYDAADIWSLLSTCLNQTSIPQNSSIFRCWEEPARTWLLCGGHEPLVSYLLLEPSESPMVHEDVLAASSIIQTVGVPPPLSCETTVLSHFTSQLTRTLEMWKEMEQERRHVNLDSFTMLCKMTYLTCDIATSFKFRDTHRQSQLQDQASTLLDVLSRFASSPACDEARADAYLSIFSSTLTGLYLCRRDRDGQEQPDGETTYTPSECERLVCGALANSTRSRRELAQAHVDQNTMDLDDEFQSQGSGQGQQTSDAAVLSNDLEVGFGKPAMRDSISLYAHAMVALTQDGSSPRDSEAAASVVLDYLQQSPTTLIICRDVVKALPRLGIPIPAPDLKSLIEDLLKTIKKPTYARSEVALGACIDLLLSQAPLWMDPGDKDLHLLGLDVYEWWTVNQLRQGSMSPNVQNRLANLLVRLCQIQEDDSFDDPDISSPRTCLFKLLSQGRITLQFHLADTIPIIFKSFVITTHETIFEDVQANLSEDIESIEGMAMRLLILANLGSQWSSLLRRCVYYIFEAAGRATSSSGHATFCIEQLAARLPLKSPRRLFSLFAPQLLYTWLDSKQHLKNLPYGAFQYSSLKELLMVNEAEIAAQLVLHEATEDMNVMSNALSTLPRDLLRRSYAKTMAYAIARDLYGAPYNPIVERRLKTLVDKEEAGGLTRSTYPIIMGHLYLIMQQDDVHDKWIENKPAYADAARALAEMKTYSCSLRELPRSQQPSSPSPHFIDQLERLNRRIGHTPGSPWDPSYFPMTARMLLNTIDDSLGSLHTSLTLRRLRILISMGGESVFQGFSLEMLIHSIRPFVSDRECADDVIGVLWFLLDHGRAHLFSNLPFLRGAIMLLVLQMRRYSRAKQDQMTQQSQHSATTQKMAEFQSWLVAYLRDSFGQEPTSADKKFAEALGSLRLPGNAKKGTAESALLLFLLDQQSLAESLCSRADTAEAISLLSEDFQAPDSVYDDCLGDDGAANHYSGELWQSVQQASLSESLITWAAQVVGRAYASRGVRPNHASGRGPSLRQKAVQSATSRGSIIAVSQNTIAERTIGLLFSRNRQEAGLADTCLRSFFELEGTNPDELNEFEQMLPVSVIDAVRGGAFQYQPPFSIRPPSSSNSSVKALREALSPPGVSTLEEWTTAMALTLCSYASKVPQVQMLAPLFHSPSGLAVELLPSMAHLLLYREAGESTALHTELSSALRACIAQTDSSFHAKQRFVLDFLVYLRGQPYPSEETKADRRRWLEVDCLSAAEAGVRCGQPATALLFAELEDAVPISAAPGNKRSSTRTSQLFKPAVSEDLLLNIYEQMEEPDSFYGVEQPASLASVLNRLDHEADGFKGLMFRSAQMDSNLRNSQNLSEKDAVGMVHSLSTLSFDSLTLSLLSKDMGASASCPDDMLNAAKSLQQWDLAIPETKGASASTIFSALQELSRATNLRHVQARLQTAIMEHALLGTRVEKSAAPPHGWFSVLAQLTETAELLGVTDQQKMMDRWHLSQSRKDWMHLGNFADANPIVANRQTVFGLLRRNADLTRALHLDRKQCNRLEAEALLDVSKFAREHSRLQEALTAMATLDNMHDLFETANLNITGAIKYETASVLWDAGEAAASVKMLRDALTLDDLDTQDLAIGRAGLYAQLGHQLAEARLEKPEVILSNYLKPAISCLNKQKLGKEAGKVYHEFATFCDNELQNPSNRENIERITKNRQAMEQKMKDLEQAIRDSKRTGGDRTEMGKQHGAAKKWAELDFAEEKRLIKERRVHVHQSLQNYLLALQASDDHDLGVLRFFALWLENCEDEEANAIARKYIPSVPSWKFVLLMNQLMSRVGDESTLFQQALQQLLVRICEEHPHHSLHHLFAARSSTGSDSASQSRYNAAVGIYNELRKHQLKDPKQKTAFVDRVFQMNGYYDALANWDATQRNSTKFLVKDCREAHNISRYVPQARLPPVTMTIALRPSARYDDVPVVTRYDGRISVMSGNSAPKMISCLASDGGMYKQLFKSGDDLRQDAIMEQVFEEVSKMLRNHKATRQRDLKVRTYKVVPLSAKSGIIEFVPNSLPFQEYLKPAHSKYHPEDYRHDKCRTLVDTAYKNGSSTEQRIKVFRDVCDHQHPVLRHFFFERFNDPDEWFQKRTAYTRTTASISILGYILGLGDRHNSNVMLDQRTGEVVHIDLGVAFEAGRVLPIPELVPFRLTRDIVDGMGVTKIEGVFRRCCEFTLDAVREDKGSIMTLLNVLRYDPLYSWQSNSRAKKAQGGGRAGRDVDSSTRRDQEAGDADRALSIVEKKLSKTLSTAAMVNELIQQAMDEKNLATLFCGWAAWW